MVNYTSKICVRADSDNTGLPPLLSKKLIEPFYKEGSNPTQSIHVISAKVGMSVMSSSIS